MAESTSVCNGNGVPKMEVAQNGADDVCDGNLFAPDDAESNGDVDVENVFNKVSAKNNAYR